MYLPSNCNFTIINRYQLKYRSQITQKDTKSVNLHDFTIIHKIFPLFPCYNTRPKKYHLLVKYSSQTVVIAKKNPDKKTVEEALQMATCCSIECDPRTIRKITTNPLISGWLSNHPNSLIEMF